MAQPPSEISFADIVRISETEEQVLNCLDEERGCPAWPSCRILDTLNEAYQQMIKKLEETTIQDLVDKVNQIDKDLNWIGE